MKAKKAKKKKFSKIQILKKIRQIFYLRLKDEEIGLYF